ncbi:N-acetylmuramoyl-L-alanine amidase [Ornithobacterium rhinotracheale]|uniref:N-acetylmuramoyl-L-alanine amidase n=1 Tax=Ornithobacterium rhinotracheale TaxID=28251 RepID=UPI00129C226B|nr:N-acetylmuramoyl-L-alanine amidase [Ornithobacterium rhinotracheale]MRI64289.1 N-acetylmuramoyl-L-alanine amidase [Ornithobacterium rhinotracheale]MRJ08505.1 N-acetylmuramoyl-L-alanine amidase [Ornithobacterium rhinotracheale]UOH76780.1 N-acetylmuramoyl-L-alanine amidase [Ornithobacterium rhinotracheale]
MKNYWIKCMMLLGALSVVSCTTTKEVKVIKTITKTKIDTVYINPFKDVDVNNYVVAKPKGYTINNDYYPAVSQDFRQKFLILHYTALDTPKSLMVLSERNVSVHYVVNDYDDNQINALVSENKRAWHAGVSYWGGRTNLNDSSIGIEIVNLGNAKGYYQEFPDYQIKKVGALAKDIVTRYQIDPVFVLGHSDIAPQRKPDPGPRFPWKRLYDEYGVGAWYDEETKNFYLNQFPYTQIEDINFIADFQKDLATYGYEISPLGYWDEKSKNVVAAFQKHFRPDNYDGVLDAETWAILKALIKKYKSK